MISFFFLCRIQHLVLWVMRHHCLIQRLIQIMPSVQYRYSNGLDIHLPIDISIEMWDYIIDSYWKTNLLLLFFFFSSYRMLFKVRWHGKTWVVQVFLLFHKYQQCPMFGFHDGLLRKSFFVFFSYLILIGMIHLLKMFYQ